MRLRRSILVDNEADPVPVSLPQANAAQPARSALTHMTVAAFVKLNGLGVKVTTLASHGKNLAALSRQQGIPIEDVEDPRWGSVHAYDVGLLREYFKDYFPKS